MLMSACVILAVIQDTHLLTELSQTVGPWITGEAASIPTMQQKEKNNFIRQMTRFERLSNPLHKVRVYH